MPASSRNARKLGRHCGPAVCRWVVTTVRLAALATWLTACAQSLPLQPSPTQPSPTQQNRDPYLWLEAAVDEPQVHRWLADQQEQTRAWRNLQAAYAPIRQQLADTWDHSRWRVADIRQDQVFYFYNVGFDNHYRLYQQPLAEFMASGPATEASGTPARLLISPERLISAELLRISVSPDGQRLAYQLEHTGSDDERFRLWYEQPLADWREPTGDFAPPPIVVTTDTGVWPAETFLWPPKDTGGPGFFVASVPGPGAGEWYSQLYRYATDTAPQLIYQTAPGSYIDELHHVRSARREEGQGLLIAVSSGSDATGPVWRSLRIDAQHSITETTHQLAGGETAVISAAPVRYVGSRDDELLFLAPGPRGNGQIVSTNAGSAVVSETDMPLLNAVVTAHGLVLEYLHNGSSQLRFVPEEVGPELFPSALLALPVPVRLDDLRVVGDGTRQQLLFSYSGLLTPSHSEVVDLWAGTRQLLRRDNPAFDADAFDVNFYRIASDDGVDVPVYVAGRRALFDGTADSRTAGYAAAAAFTPERGAGGGVLLEVYGGFGMPMETGFSVSRLAWMQLGGIYVVAGPRGGGDYGPQWHLRGQAVDRANSVNDVQAVADWVRRQRWAADSTMALTGRSHGGLLATEVVQQNPQGFAALITDSALFDLERLMEMGADPRWQREYSGTASSPYTALLQSTHVEHPPTLLVTRLHDNVVSPAHSFKYYAALQSRNAADEVDLLSIVDGEGHDSSGQVHELIDDYALRWTFLRAQGLKAQGLKAQGLKAREQPDSRPVGP